MRETLFDAALHGEPSLVLVRLESAPKGSSQSGFLLFLQLHDLDFPVHCGVGMTIAYSQ